MENKRKIGNRGITLISLVVTIIILLILAGVTISQLTENGLFNKTKQAKEEAEKAQLKEEIEMAIMGIQMEEIQKGNNVTLDSLASGQLVENLEGITAELENDEIIGEYKDYNYKIDENLNVTIENKVQGISISYKISPEGYTKEDITLTITAKSTNGEIESIKSLNNNNIKETEQEGVFTITANGEYEFEVTDNTGDTKNKTINIQKIDKLGPKDITIEISDIEIDGFTIKASAEDAEASETNEKSVKSGIGRYEYFVKEKTQADTEYTTYNSTDNKYIVTGLKAGTEYMVYVKVYDKAENDKTSTTISETTYTLPIPPSSKITFNEQNATEKALDYPILTLGGMMNCSLEPNVGESVTLEITSPKKENIKYYYSLDGGESWTEYISKVETQYQGEDKIQVKSVYKDRVDSVIIKVKKYTKNLELQCTAQDSLTKEAYDENPSTNSSIPGTSYRFINVDPTCWEKYISMYYSTSYDSWREYGAISFLTEKDDKVLKNGYICDLSGQMGINLQTKSVKIPLQTFWIRLCWWNCTS